MSFSVPNIVTYILAWSSFVAAIWFLFEKAGDTLKPNIKTSISNWLHNVNVKSLEHKWPSQFAIIFDNIFGRKHFSFRCFLMSCLASSIFSIIVFFIWKTFNNQVYEFYASQWNFLNAAIGAVFYTIILNWLPDYISLLETRIIIRLMEKSKNTLKILALLIVDLILTTLIWISFLFLFSMANSITKSNFIPPTTSIPTVLSEAINFIGRDQNSLSIAGIYFYTTFFTSIWIWLYVVSGVLLKIFLGPLKILKIFFNVEDQPLRSIGFVSTMLITIIFFLYPVLR